VDDREGAVEATENGCEAIVRVLVDDDQPEVAAGLRLQRLEKSRGLGDPADGRENQIDARRAGYSARG
jgi:hypothetical protein